MMNSQTTQQPQAVIDIGTNSTRLLIFKTDASGKLVRINKSVRSTRMGQDLGKTGRLHPDAMARNMAALKEYIAITGDYHTRSIYVFGTSALRDASNAGEFIARVKNELGLTIDVITGEQEATYGFIGVSQCFDERILIFDIGGGSTELILGENHQLMKLVSLNMGCVRGTEAFIHHDPPLSSELAAVRENAAGLLKKVMPDYLKQKPFRLVGIGGTATTLSTIHQGLVAYDSDKVQKSRIDQVDLREMVQGLAAMPLARRKEVAGLNPKRADIILAGACVLDTILKATGIKTFTICDYDNLEGAAFQKFIKS